MTAGTPSLGRATALLLALGALCAAPGCGPQAGRPAVSLTLTTAKATPRDASVYIDEEFIGPLSIVTTRGVRLPVGEHRVTIEKVGYFPWDKLVVADREPVRLDVVLDPIPD